VDSPTTAILAGNLAPKGAANRNCIILFFVFVTTKLRMIAGQFNAFAALNN